MTLRVGVLLSAACALSLTSTLVPAVASGATGSAQMQSSVSVDDRKKPKPTKPPKPTVAIPKEARAIERWINAQPKGWQQAKSTFILTVDPELAGTQWEKLSLDTAKATFEIHALLGQPVTAPYRVYVGWDKPWLESVVPLDVCGPISEFSQAYACRASDVIYTRYERFKAYSPTLMPTSNIAPVMRFGATGLIGHELTHLVQESLYPQRAVRTYPSDGQWLVEGWAVMTQTMIAMRAYNLPYTTARDYALRLMDAKCSDQKLKDLLAPAWFTSCVYLKGFLAMEYLMGKTGDMKAGWTWAAQDAATAREAFAKAFPSLDMDTFMAEADIYADKEIALFSQRLWPR